MTRADSPVVSASWHVHEVLGSRPVAGHFFPISSFFFFCCLPWNSISGGRATARMTVRIQLLLIVHLFEEDARLLVKCFLQTCFLEVCVLETNVVSTNRSYFHNMLHVTYNTLRIPFSRINQFRSLKVSERLYLGGGVKKNSTRVTHY